MGKIIYAIPNKQKTAFHIPSDWSRSLLLEWFKKYKKFKIIPDEEDTIKGRSYLEGAVRVAYCEWQYGIDPRKNENKNQCRFLFMRDFNYDIIEDREGNPIRVPKDTSKGRVKDITNNYTDWAVKNGAPVPNPELFKLYRDKYKNDLRFSSFYEFLDFLGLDCDAMPSEETLSKLKVGEKELEYPVEDIDPSKTPF